MAGMAKKVRSFTYSSYVHVLGWLLNSYEWLQDERHRQLLGGGGGALFWGVNKMGLTEASDSAGY